MNYLFSMLIGLAVACLVGCSSNPMVGTWKIQTPEAEFKEAEARKMPAPTSLIEFKADGTFVISADEGDRMTEVKGIYNVDGFNVTLIATEGDGRPLGSHSAFEVVGEARAATQGEPIYLAVTRSDDLRLVGIWAQGRWFDPQQVRNPLPRSPMTFDVYNLKGKVGQIKTLGTVEQGECGCGGHFFLKVVREIEASNLAVSGNKCKAVTMKRLPTNNPDYIKMVSDFLKQNKAKTRKVRVSELFVQDINGDGKKEALVVANSRTKPSEEDYEDYGYGLVLFRFVDSRGRTVVKPLIYDHGMYNIEAVFDIQGDGKMEIVVESSYFGGVSSRCLNSTATA